MFWMIVLMWEIIRGQYTATRWLERRIVFEEAGFGAAKSKIDIACTILKRVARQVIGARVV